MRSSSKQSQFLKRVNCQTADTKNKLHQGVNRNSFSYGKAMAMYCETAFSFLVTYWAG